MLLPLDVITVLFSTGTLPDEHNPGLREAVVKLERKIHFFLLIQVSAF